MRIIVSHPDRQHVTALLQLLVQRRWLAGFYTLFAVGPLLGRLPWVGATLAKRALAPEVAALTHQQWWLKIVQVVGKVDGYRYIYRWFDAAVAHRLRRQDFDLLITYENANLRSLQVAKARGKTTVLDLAAVHHIQQQKLWDTYPHFRSILPGPAYFEQMNAYKTEALRYTDYCLCLSSYARDTLVAGGFPAARILVIPLGIDPQLFPAKTHYPTDAQAPLRVLYVGRITAAKGLLELCAATAGLPVELRLVGPLNPGEDLLPQFPPGVAYQPALPRAALAAEYRQADLFVNPSYTDSWAQTVLEAMACGTPVLVSENTGAKDAVVQGGGEVLPVADVAAWRTRIQYYAQHREALAPLGRAAAEVARRYTWAHYHQQLAAALQKIASDKTT